MSEVYSAIMERLITVVHCKSLTGLGFMSGVNHQSYIQYVSKFSQFTISYILYSSRLTFPTNLHYTAIHVKIIYTVYGNTSITKHARMEHHFIDADML